MPEDVTTDSAAHGPTVSVGGRAPRWLRVLGAAVAGMLLVSCAAVSGSGVLSNDEALREYRDAQSGWDLPGGKGYRPLVTRDEGEQAQVAYPAGQAAMSARLVYECEWKREWLRVRPTDKVAAQTALTNLDRLLSDGVFLKADAGYVTGLRDELTAGGLGDPTSIQSDVDLNCP